MTNNRWLVAFPTTSVWFSLPSCGSSPPPGCGISLPILIVGPFLNRSKFPINLPLNLSSHTHKSTYPMSFIKYLFALI